MECFDFLFQTYIVCQLAQKIDTLWSFVKNYLKSKIVIFFATCKQVTNSHCLALFILVSESCSYDSCDCILDVMLYLVYTAKSIRLTKIAVFLSNYVVCILALVC